jgi:hypothetical protein
LIARDIAVDYRCEKSKSALLLLKVMTAFKSLAAQLGAKYRSVPA